MSIKSEMKKARNISKKEILTLLVIAVVLLVIYVLSSGILKSSVPYKNILTLSEPKVLAENDGWGIYTIDKEGMLPYFTYNGDVEPAESIHVRLVVFDKKGAMKKEDWYLWYDRHLFVGEHRYYFPYEWKNMSKFAAKIVWDRAASLDTSSAYIYSDKLSEPEKESAYTYIDKIQVNENDIVDVK